MGIFDLKSSFIFTSYCGIVSLFYCFFVGLYTKGRFCQDILNMIFVTIPAAIALLA
jgi:hypothetical protein